MGVALVTGNAVLVLLNFTVLQALQNYGELKTSVVLDSLSETCA